ncbi:hypothetical protein VTH06DRAFT_8692 [Thermothelomyces fergusii]
MKLMGAEETEMFKLNSQSATLLQPHQPIRQPSVPGQHGFSSGNDKGRNSGPRIQINQIQTAQSAAGWGDYAETLKQEDKLLAQRVHLATGQTRKREIVVNDVYQPVTLSDGKRIGGGNKVAQQVHLSYSQAVRGSHNSGQGGLDARLANMSLNDHPNQGGHGHFAMASSDRIPRLPITENQPPGSAPPTHHEGEASRGNPASTARQGQTDPSQQVPTSQHLSTRPTITTMRNASVRLPEAQLDLLTDPLPLDTSPSGEMHPTPPPSEMLWSYQVPAQGQTTTSTQAQGNEDGQVFDGGVQDGDREEWLIEL